MIEYKACQTQSVPYISEGKADIGDISIGTRLKLILKRRLSPRNKRKIKRHLNPVLSLLRFQSFSGQSVNSPARSVLGSATTILRLKQGDLVRVKSEEEIQATADQWHELKGCLFMDEMKQYCGSIQRVLNRVERFVDERDYRVKKASGVVLLEGLLCRGTAKYGRCDRACYYFWREEWLEKIE